MTDEERLSILRDALYHIKDHQSIVMKGNVKMSSTWNIANNALIEAELDPLTDNDRKTIGSTRKLSN